MCTSNNTKKQQLNVDILNASPSLLTSLKIFKKLVGIPPLLSFRVTRKHEKYNIVSSIDYSIMTHTEYKMNADGTIWHLNVFSPQQKI